MRISVDGRRIRNNKVAFSNLSGIVWTRPKLIQHKMNNRSRRSEPEIRGQFKN